MPDLTLEPMAACASFETFKRDVQGKTGRYTVLHCRLDPVEADRQMCETGFTCTCKAFSFSKSRTCKHIDSVREQFCGWDELVDGGYLGNDKCPRCGGPVIHYMAGV